MCFRLVSRVFVTMAVVTAPECIEGLFGSRLWSTVNLVFYFEPNITSWLSDEAEQFHKEAVLRMFATFFFRNQKQTLARKF